MMYSPSSPRRITIRPRMESNNCCVSIQGLHPSKASPFRETLLTTSAVFKCDGLTFGAFPGGVTRCFTLKSRFLPPRPTKVTIYATQCRHFLSFFRIFQCAKNLMWYVRPRRIVAVHPPKRGKRRSICGLRIGTAFAWRCDIISLHMHRHRSSARAPTDNVEHPLANRDGRSKKKDIHTQRKTAGIKTNRHVFHTESCAAAPKEMWQNTSCWWHRGVSQVFPLSI